MKYFYKFSQILANHSFLVVTILSVVFFTFLGSQGLDPDFGWHYQMGSIITTTGIPKADPFTFTMPSYPFVDYEWGSNVLLYVVYSHSGKMLLAFLFALFAVLSMHILTHKKTPEHFLLYSLGLSGIVQYMGIRPQVLSWVFVAILIKVLYDKKLWNTWRFGIPLLMLLWVNMHGSYPIAFIILGGYKAVEALELKKIDFKDILVGVLALGATLINPYGIQNWVEVISQMGFTSLYRKTIGEWQPAYTHLVFGYWFLLALLIFFVWRYKAKAQWAWVAVSFVMSIMAFTSIRHVPLFILTSIPLLLFCLTCLKKEVAKIQFGRVRYEQLIRILSLSAVFILFGQVALSMHGVYSEERAYPSLAVRFIQENIHEPIFNIYEWGGYLIWKIPGQRVFVDGRTPGFSWKAPQGESSSIYKEYLEIGAGLGDWEGKLETYNVRYALVNTKDFSYVSPPDWQKTIEHWYAKWLVGWGDDTYYTEIPLGFRLKSVGWTIVYQDNIATILQKL